VAYSRGYVSEHLGDPNAVLVLCSAGQCITAGADDDVLVEVGMGVGPVGFG
jgi:hypothetical protein